MDFDIRYSNFDVRLEERFYFTKFLLHFRFDRLAQPQIEIGYNILVYIELVLSIVSTTLFLPIGANAHFYLNTYLYMVFPHKIAV